MFTQHENEETMMFIIRVAARATSVIVFLVLALFYVGEGLSVSQITAKELVGLLFFPVGLLVGFFVGWHNELWGGLIAVISTAAFYLIYGLLLSGSAVQGWAFLVFAIPGALFLLYGLLKWIHVHSAGHKAVI